MVEGWVDLKVVEVGYCIDGFRWMDGNWGSFGSCFFFMGINHFFELFFLFLVELIDDLLFDDVGGFLGDRLWLWFWLW